MVLWFSWPTMLRSVAVFEKFAETWSPGYWLFKILLIVFAALLLLQAAGHVARDVAQLLDPRPEPGAPPPNSAQARP
jgi:TRAP-type mannitol/chloroaromatic compound transport system permease small subunit